MLKLLSGKKVTKERPTWNGKRAVRELQSLNA
jgi:hypothetical protein